MTTTSPTRPRRGFWAKILYTLALGPLPVALIALASKFTGTKDQSTTKFAIMLGAYWGLTLGVMRGSLLRMIVGLNLGSLCGFMFYKLGISGSGNNFFVMSIFVVCGLLLFCATCHNRKTPLRSAAYNLVFVFIACVDIALLANCVAHNFRENWLGWTVMTLVPFGSGAAILVCFLGEDEPPEIYLRAREKYFPAPR